MNKNFDSIRNEIEKLKIVAAENESMKKSIDDISTKINQNIQMINNMSSNVAQNFQNVNTRLLTIEQFCNNLIQQSNSVTKQTSEPVTEETTEPNTEETSEPSSEQS
jgi:ABC-type transporter Mla subunit MlaD